MLARPLAAAFALLTVVPLCALFGSGCMAPRRPDGGRGLLQPGAPLPDLAGEDQNGKTHRLQAVSGRPVVVYFYPMDDTPGCTKEACAFRDVWARYQSANVALFGVSHDSRESHAAFATKHRLPFPLIDDTSGIWARAFGVRRRGGLYERVTFLAGPTGELAKTYPAVDPGVHAAQVLSDIGDLARASNPHDVSAAARAAPTRVDYGSGPP